MRKVQWSFVSFHIFVSGLDLAVYIHLEKQQNYIFTKVSVGNSLTDKECYKTKICHINFSG